MSTLTRLKYYIAVYASTLGIVFAILAIASVGVAGHTYLNPPIKQIPGEEVNVQNFEATIEHSAHVIDINTNKTQSYEPGEVLRNQPVYNRETMPEVTLTMKADIPDDRPVNISYQLMLRHSATYGGEELWQDEDAIRNEITKDVIENKTTQVEDGDFVSSTTIRIDKLERMISEAQQVTTVGSISSQLGFKLSYNSPVQGGGTYEGQLSSFIQPEISGQAYSFPSDWADEETKRQSTQSETKELDPNIQRVGMFALIGVLLGAAAVGVIWWRNNNVNIQELETIITKEKHSPWISEGEFPTDTSNQYVYITSLQDLVDIAIDTNKRVLYDNEMESYALVDESIIYYYSPRPEALKEFLNTAR